MAVPLRLSGRRASTSITAARTGGASVRWPYMREQEVSDRIGEVLKDIYVPETVRKTLAPAAGHLMHM